MPRWNGFATMDSATISVSATSHREAPPDQATIEATAIGTGDSAAIALASARDRAATIRATLETPATDHLRTVELQVEKTTEMFDPIPDAEYQATAYLELQCPPETSTDVVVAITDGGGHVRRIEFELYRERFRALQNDALEAATERAHEKAERIAATEDLIITGARKISTTETTTEPTSLVEEAIDANPDADLQPSPIEVVENVKAVYTVTEN